MIKKGSIRPKKKPSVKFQKSPKPVKGKAALKKQMLLKMPV